MHLLKRIAHTDSYNGSIEKAVLSEREQQLACMCPCKWMGNSEVHWMEMGESDSFQVASLRENRVSDLAGPEQARRDALAA